MIFGVWILRIAEDRDDGSRWGQLAQQFQPLGTERAVMLTDARDVAARPVQAGHHAELDRVSAHHEHDRNCRCRRLRRRRRRKGARENHRHLAADEFGGEGRQPVVLPFRPAEFDRHVLPFDETGVVQSLAERGHLGAHIAVQ
jgi:hypothetical protein